MLNHEHIVELAYGKALRLHALRAAAGANWTQFWQHDLPLQLENFAEEVLREDRKTRDT